MEYPVNGGSCNYAQSASEFIDKHFPIGSRFEVNLFTLIDLLLENVVDHGSKSCTLIYGVNSTCEVVEIFDENGGFDLKNLSKEEEKGGAGYRKMINSKCIISHSADGKRTFIQVILKNKKIQRI